MPGDAETHEKGAFSNNYIGYNINSRPDDKAKPSKHEVHHQQPEVAREHEYTYSFSSAKYPPYSRPTYPYPPRKQTYYEYPPPFSGEAYSYPPPPPKPYGYPRIGWYPPSHEEYGYPPPPPQPYGGYPPQVSDEGGYYGNHPAQGYPGSFPPHHQGGYGYGGGHGHGHGHMGWIAAGGAAAGAAAYGMYDRFRGHHRHGGGYHGKFKQGHQGKFKQYAHHAGKFSRQLGGKDQEPCGKPPVTLLET